MKAIEGASKVVRRRSSSCSSTRITTFGHVEISPYYVSPKGYSMALNELNPILKGHALAISKDRTVFLAELRKEYLIDLMDTVRIMQRDMVKEMNATAFNISVKDGPSAGQPIGCPCHVHVIPRIPGDIPFNDAIYTMIDEWTPLKKDSPNTSKGAKLIVPKDSERVPRTSDVMARETETLRKASETCKLVESYAAEYKQIFFGSFAIPTKNQVFYVSKSNLSYGLVNLKPLVEGHVLIISKRVVSKLSDLTPDEFADLIHSVIEVQGILKLVYGAKGFNVAIQDGKDAGQSVPHVHVHVIPRR